MKKCMAVLFLSALASMAAATPIDKQPSREYATARETMTSSPEKAAEPLRAQTVSRPQAVSTTSRVALDSAQLSAIASVAMVFVGALQLLLFFWQLVLMRRTVKDATASAHAAQSAAEAASLNARAAIGVELPLITASVFGLLRTNKPSDPYDSPGGSVNVGFPKRYCCLGPISFKNSGRTPAVLDLLEIGWIVAEELPPIPTYPNVVSVRHLSAIAPNDEVDMPYQPSIELSEDEQIAISSESKWLWLYGSLHYTDFMGDRRQARFCVRYERRSRGNLNPFAFFSDCLAPGDYVKSIVSRM